MAMIAQYARPDTIVSTAWVADHLHDPNVRTVEVDVDTSAYQQGRVPGAPAWNWTTELCDTVMRDIIPKERLEALLSGPASATPLLSSCTATTIIGLPPGPCGN